MALMYHFTTWLSFPQIQVNKSIDLLIAFDEWIEFFFLSLRKWSFWHTFIQLFSYFLLRILRWIRFIMLLWWFKLLIIIRKTHLRARCSCIENYVLFDENTNWVYICIYFREALLIAFGTFETHLGLFFPQ